MVLQIIDKSAGQPGIPISPAILRKFFLEPTPITGRGNP